MSSIQKTECKTLEVGNYDLIQGDFTPDEVANIFTNVLQNEINIHKLRNISHYVQYECDDEASLKRIEDVKTCLNSLTNLATKAKEQGWSLRIKSKLTIEII